MLFLDRPPVRKDAGNAGEAAAKQFSNRGATRVCIGTLLYSSLSPAGWDLDEAVRRYLAWESILTEKDTLDLSPHQVKQADAARAQVAP